ncbi:MAG: hypothetical protein LDL41_02440 [Coleofasciculus sp. S288]|nr:hypothetical protein [Coleofasciculus sp. S288]
MNFPSLLGQTCLKPAPEVLIRNSEWLVDWLVPNLSKTSVLCHSTPRRKMAKALLTTKTILDFGLWIE